MKITKIRAQVRSVCLTGEIWFGEIELDSTEGYLYVTVCDDEGLHYSVSKKSVYDYFINVTDEPSELAEEYHSWQKAKNQNMQNILKCLETYAKSFINKPVRFSFTDIKRPAFIICGVFLSV